MELKSEESISAVNPPVAVIGLGGFGYTVATWIAKKGIAGGKIITTNADVKHLTFRRADKLIHLGEKLYKGHGYGNYPETCAKTAKGSLSEIRAELEGLNLLFFVTGLEEGTEIGAIQAIARVARELDILTILCVITPFKSEIARREKVIEAINSIAQSCDSTIVIDNSKLGELAGNLPLKETQAITEALIGAFIKNTTENITQPSLVNLHFADLRAIMERGGISSIGIGEGQGEGRVIKAVSQALAAPLLNISDISDAYGVLLHIVGGEDLTLEEVAIAGEVIMDKIPNTKRVIWGAKVDESLGGIVRVMAVLTGVKDPFSIGIEEKIKNMVLKIERQPNLLFSKDLFKELLEDANKAETIKNDLNAILDGFAKSKTGFSLEENTRTFLLNEYIYLVLKAKGKKV